MELPEIPMDSEPWIRATVRGRKGCSWVTRCERVCRSNTRVVLSPVPPTLYVDVLALPRTSECGLIWIGLYRGNQVKMKSLEWALIQNDWCLYKKGDLESDRHTWRMPCDDLG